MSYIVYYEILQAALQIYLEYELSEYTINAHTLT